MDEKLVVVLDGQSNIAHRRLCELRCDYVRHILRTSFRCGGYDVATIVAMMTVLDGGRMDK